MNLGITIKESIVKALGKEKTKELMLGLMEYQMEGVKPKFSSDDLGIYFLYLTKEMNKTDKTNNNVEESIEEKKARRSEINRQNVMKRWAKKEEVKNTKNTNENLYNDDTKNTKNILYNKNTKNTNEISYETLDFIKKNTNKNLYNDDTKNTKNILYDKNTKYTNKNLYESIDITEENRNEILYKSDVKNTNEDLYQGNTKNTNENLYNDTDIFSEDVPVEIPQVSPDFQELHKEVTEKAESIENTKEINNQGNMKSVNSTLSKVVSKDVKAKESVEEDDIEEFVSNINLEKEFADVEPKLEQWEIDQICNTINDILTLGKHHKGLKKTLINMVIRNFKDPELRKREWEDREKKEQEQNRANGWWQYMYFPHMETKEDVIKEHPGIVINPVDNLFWWHDNYEKFYEGKISELVEPKPFMAKGQPVISLNPATVEKAVKTNENISSETDGFFLEQSYKKSEEEEEKEKRTKKEKEEEEHIKNINNYIYFNKNNNFNNLLNNNLNYINLNNINNKNNNIYNNIIKATSVPKMDENTEKNAVEENNLNPMSEPISSATSTATISTPKKRESKPFVVPTMEELKAYVDEKKLDVDIEHWFNYYESEDWKVKNRNGVYTPMKNWKKALITWSINAKKFKEQQYSSNTKSYSRNKPVDFSYQYSKRDREIIDKVFSENELEEE